MNGYVNPLKVTLSAHNNIIISGFDKIETMTKDDVEGTDLQEGDICFFDDEGDIIGYICFSHYFQ